MVRIKEDFFENKETLKLAKELIGKILVYEYFDESNNKVILKGVINETEAYTEEDESCHAFGGKMTKKNEVMFKRHGHLYVYFTYGMYHCCNIVTGISGKAEAVLIRSIIPIEGKDIMIENRNGNTKNIADGPGKLCMAYGFNKLHNGIDMLDEKSNIKIYIEDLGYVAKNINKTTRIGISKAKELEWRFIAKEFENTNI